jgi:TRAP-type C4-dicarboxylate transport system permease small subunit
MQLLEVLPRSQQALAVASVLVVPLALSYLLITVLLSYDLLQEDIFHGSPATNIKWNISTCRGTNI